MVAEQQGAMAFLDAPGGTGNTFLLNLLRATVRKDKQIAIAVASSGIAAALLDIQASSQPPTMSRVTSPKEPEWLTSSNNAN